MKAYCDGGARGNPGEAYGSFKIAALPIVRREYGQGTNNEAEYKTLINVLSRLHTLKVEEAEIHTDSALLVGQVGGNWKCNAQNLIELRDMAKKLMKPGFKLIKVKRDVLVDILGH